MADFIYNSAWRLSVKLPNYTIERGDHGQLAHLLRSGATGLVKCRDRYSSSKSKLTAQGDIDPADRQPACASRTNGARRCNRQSIQT
jgi:hypothetical protein